MKIIKYLERYEIMNELINAENTGTPKEFAGKFRICKSQLNNLIDELKDVGAPIEYSKTRQTYYYTNYEFYEKLKNALVLKEQLKKIFGGYKRDSLLSDFL